MAGFIEGVDRGQSTLFPERLEDWVGGDHLVRVVDLFVEELDLTGLGFERARPARTGRPGYHPAVLLKLFIYGYLNRVPSSRRLEREAGRNVEVMWLTARLAPDHKTIADFRRDNGPAIRRTCAQFVELCRRIGVLKGDCVAIDGSKFKAVNNRDRNFTKGKIASRIAHLEASVERYIAVRHKVATCAVVGVAFALSVVGIGSVKQQFFPTSDRPEVLVEVRLPEGTSIETTTAMVEKLEHWLDSQPEAGIVTSYVGQGAPRFFFAMSPELPDPAFAKIVVLTPDAESREVLKHRLREALAQGLAPEAYVRVTQLVFGPYTPFPVEFRVMGPDPAQLYSISEQALDIMRGVPDVRQANRDWGNRTPVLRFVPDHDRLNLIGLSPAEVGQQLQFLLTGIPVTQVREDIRSVPIVARSAGGERLDPARLADFSLMSRDGRAIPLDQIGHAEIRLEEPILKRRDRVPVITIRSDINEATQPPEVSKQIMTALQPLIASLPAGYRIEMGGSSEEAAKANAALGKVFPLMIAITLIVVMLQVRSFSMMAMVLMTAPLGLVGAVPMLLAFDQPFGFNAILGLIGLAGILMRNTLILTEQIKENRAAGHDGYSAVIEATVQRTRPVILTALAAVLAFIPLTHSVFWGSMAYTLIGGTAVGAVLILLFLPALLSPRFAWSGSKTISIPNDTL